jgi:hypothetical protein
LFFFRELTQQLLHSPVCMQGSMTKSQFFSKHIVQRLV